MSDPYSVEEFDRAMSRPFGRESDGDARLRQELVEAGLTEAGARGVLKWVEEFTDSGAQEAVHLGAGFNGVRPGRVASIAYERAEAVLLRHRPSLTTTRESSIDDFGGEMGALRDELVSVLERRPGYGTSARLMAETRADAAVSSLQEWGLRDGWSRQQLEEHLRERIAKETRDLDAQVREWARKDRPGQPARMVEVLSSTPAAREASQRVEVSEADFDAAFGLTDPAAAQDERVGNDLAAFDAAFASMDADRAAAAAFGRTIKEK